MKELSAKLSQIAAAEREKSIINCI